MGVSLNPGVTSGRLVAEMTIFCSFRHLIAAIATIDRRGKDRMKSHTEYLTFNIPSKMAFQTGIGEGQVP
jgi:hypothetical protein